MKNACWIAVVALLIAIVGCGGGGGGTVSGTTATTGTTSSTSGFMPDSQRNTVLNAVSTALSTVPQTNGQWTPSLAAAALSKVSGLTNVTVAPNGDVIALFSDGVPFSLFSGQPMPQSPKIPPSSRPGNVEVAPTTIPNGLNATMLDTGAEVLAVGETQTPAQLAAILSKAQYSVTSATATIAAFQALGSSTNSCFVFHGHGGECYQPQSPTSSKLVATRGFGLQTSIRAYFDSTSTLYNGLTYKAALDKGDLGVAVANFAFARTNAGAIIPNTYLQAPFYFITSNFVKDYSWKFSTGSLVYLSCCDGNSNDAASFQAALQKAGASTVVGWTNETQPEMMNPAEEYFLDRMTGANLLQPVSPPRRPFSFTACKLVEDPLGITKYNLPAGLGPTEMTLWPTNSTFQALAPSLDAMLNNGNGSLILLGMFGNTTGSVLLAGKPLTVLQWTNNSISCSLPAAVSGNVVVQLPVTGGSRNTNPRELTMWQGTVTDTQVEDGSQIAQATMKLALQSSISPYYLNPSSTTLTQSSAAGMFSVPDPLACFLVTATNSSSCNLTAGGSFDDGGNFYRLTYSGPSSVQATGSNLNYWNLAIGVPLKPGGEGRMGFQVYTTASLQTFIQYENGSTSSTTGSQIWQSYRQVGANNVGDIITQFDGSDNMQSGSYTSSNGVTETTTWSTLTCTTPPSTSSTIAR